MIAAGGGHFAVVTSLMGLVLGARSGPDMQAPSTPCTAGSRPSGPSTINDGIIRVTMVAPGFVPTAISLNALTAELARPQGSMDDATAHGISPSSVPPSSSGIDRNKALVTPGKKEVLGYWLSRFAPGLLRRIARRAKVT